MKIRISAGSFLFLVLFILAIPLIFADNIDNILYIKIENDKIRDIGVIGRFNVYYLMDNEKSFYLGEMDNYYEPQIYTIELYDNFMKLLYKGEDLTYKTAVPYHETARYIRLFKNNKLFKDDKSDKKLIQEKEINFCNHNNICEPCYYQVCNVIETSLTCPDCLSGEKDNYCDLKQDNKCDPDCNNKDKDCQDCLYETCYYDSLDYYCMYEYSGVRCNSTQICFLGNKITEIKLEDNSVCCVDSYCTDKLPVPLKEIKAEVKTEIHKEIEKYAELKPQTNIMMWGVIIFIIVLSIITYYFIKQPEFKMSKLDLEIYSYHKDRLNYSQIKQKLVRKGYKDDDIEKAIERHYRGLK